MSDAYKNSSIPVAWYLLLTTALAGTVASLETTLHAGYLGVAYVLIVLLGRWAPRQRFSAISASLCSSLVLLVPALTQEGGFSTGVLARIALTLAAIWLAWLILLRFRRTEIVAQRSEELFRLSFDHAATGVGITTCEGRFVKVNSSICRFFGHTEQELLGLTWHDLTHPDDMEKTRESLRSMVDGGPESFSLEKRYVRKDGQTVWGLVTVAQIRDEHNDPINRSVQLLDITDRKRAEEEKLASQEWFSSSFHHAGIGIAINSLDGYWLQVNPALCRMLGYSEDEFRQRRWQDLTHPDDLDVTVVGRERLLAGEIHAFDSEKRYLHKNGRPVWTHVTVSFIRGADGSPQYFTAQIVDITERRMAEEALARERQFADRIIDTQPNLVFVGDVRSHSLVFVNQKVKAILGYTPEELLALGQDVVLSIVHPDDRDVILEMLRQVRLSSDGEIIEADYRLRHADGGWRWLTERASVLSRGKDGSAEFTIGAAEDVTVRKQMEEALKESEEILRRRNDELRDLTGRLLTAAEEERSRIALELHDDLNQQLAILGLDLGRLERQGRDSPEELGILIESLQDRIGQLSDDVRSLAYRLHPSILDYIGLEAALESECLQFSGRENLRVDFTSVDVPEDVPKDIALSLYRIAQEGLRNAARHASSPRATVALVGDSGGIRLRVKDYGCGFDPDLQNRRHGLGIIGMQERARLVNGRLTVESEPGHGTVVEVWVPLSSEG